MTHLTRAITTLTLTLLATLTLTGCYHLGSSVPQELRTVSVQTFENQTNYPQVNAITTQTIAQQLISDGTFTITDSDSARLTLQGTITSCVNTSVRYDRNRTIVTDEYRMHLTATVYVIDNKTKKLLIDGKPLVGQTTFLTRGDLILGMQDAYPRAAADLAQQLIALMQDLSAE